MNIELVLHVSVLNQHSAVLYKLVYKTVIRAEKVSRESDVS